MRGQADIDEHVREHLGQVARAAVERVVVQKHDRHAGVLRCAQQVREQQRIALV
jgi:RNase P/RNase MRP subunit POP5